MFEACKRTQDSFSCGRVFTLRPYDCEKKSDCNPDRTLGESTKSDLPWGVRPRYEQHDRKCNARETIRAAVHAHQRTKKSEDQDAGGEENTFGGTWPATRAPTNAPSPVPTNRFQETENAAPSEDCVITKVVIGAQ
jgi:hypothetical protein